MRLEDLVGAGKFLRVQGGCHNCPRARREFVPMESRNSPLIVVGEHPREEDVLAQRPFTSSSGLILRDALKAGGLEGYSTTFAVHCRVPTGNEADKEIPCCLNQFGIEEVRGYPVVALVGNVAIKAFFPGQKTNKLRGNLAYHPDYPGQRFYSMLHPAYAQRSADQMELFQQQAERLTRIVRGGGNDTVKVVQGNTPEFTAKLREYFSQKFLSIDIETNQLKPWLPGARIRSIALAKGTDEALFSHEGEAHFVTVLQALKEWLQKRSSSVLGHNLGFESMWLEYLLDFSIEAETILDTQVLAYLAWQMQMVGLKEVVSQKADGYRHLVLDPTTEKDFWRLGQYNAEDVIHPITLLRKGLVELNQKGRDLFLRVAGPSSIALSRLQMNGVPFDQDEWRRKAESLKAEKVSIIRAWQAADPLFIPGLHESGKGEQEYLFKVHNLPVISRTEKSNKAQVDEAAIKTWIRDGHTYLEHKLALRRAEKQESTYVEPYEGHLAPDGRIHPEYTNTATDSGRTSCVRPNYQNVPRDPSIRRFFAARPGWNFIQADFNQIELRIAMSLANDPVGIAAYRDGSDLHARTAQSMAGPNFTKEHRSKAKPINFALIYGGTWYTLQQYAQNSYNIIFSRAESEEFVRVFFGTYTRLQPWHTACDDYLRTNQGWGEEVVGHRFYYRDWNSSDEGRRAHAFRSHLNAQAQGPGTGYMLLYTLILAQRELVRRKLPSKILTVGEVHDSIHLEVQEDATEEALQIIETSVTKVADWCKDWLKVPLVMEYEVGRNWADAEEGKLINGVWCPKSKAA